GRHDSPCDDSHIAPGQSLFYWRHNAQNLAVLKIALGVWCCWKCLICLAPRALHGKRKKIAPAHKIRLEGTDSADNSIKFLLIPRCSRALLSSFKVACLGSHVT